MVCKLEKKVNESNAVFENISYVGQIFLLDDTVKNNICFVDNEKQVDEKKLKRAIELSYTNNFLNDLQMDKY